MSEQAGTSVADGVLARPLAAMSLLDAVRDLRRDVERTGFPLEIASVDAARASRARLVDQLADHLVPRLEELSAPAIVRAAAMKAAATPSSTATAVIRNTRRSTRVERRGMRVASSVTPSDGDNGNASVLPSRRTPGGDAGFSVPEVIDLPQDESGNFTLAA